MIPYSLIKAFYHTLVFYQDVVQFGSLQITSSGVTPSNNLLNAISSFLAIKNINARSWFGLVNQVAWKHSLSPMLPFQDLVPLPPPKKKPHTLWNENLEKAFQQSKQIIVGLEKKGVEIRIVER